MSDWVPTREAWDRFLSLLDADNQVAGERYEGIRRRLIIYFEGRKCRAAAEDLADKTIARVIKRNYDGVHIDDVVRYSYGVAKIIRLEEDEVVRREDHVRDALLRGGAFTDPEDPYDESALRYAAFEECLGKLSVSNRVFILNYYEDTGRAKIDNRKSLSDKLGISQNAVTLRAYQIRRKLQKCVQNRLKQGVMKQLRKDSH